MSPNRWLPNTRGMDDRLSKAEINKDALQETVEAGAQKRSNAPFTSGLLKYWSITLVQSWCGAGLGSGSLSQSASVSDLWRRSAA